MGEKNQDRFSSQSTDYAQGGGGCTGYHSGLIPQTLYFVSITTTAKNDRGSDKGSSLSEVLKDSANHYRT